MMGGHSGEDIHRGRGSAIRLLSRMLLQPAEPFLSSLQA